MQSLLRDAHAESVWDVFELNVDARQLAQTDARRPFELAKTPLGAFFPFANYHDLGAAGLCSVDGDMKKMPSARS